MPPEKSSNEPAPSPQDSVLQVRQILQHLEELGSKRPGILGRGQAFQREFLVARNGLDHLERSLQEQREERHRLRAIQEISQAVTSSLDLDKVLNMVMDSIIELTGAERGFMMLLDQESGRLDFRVARNMDRETLHRILL